MSKRYIERIGVDASTFILQVSVAFHYADGRGIHIIQKVTPASIRRLQAHLYHNHQWWDVVPFGWTSRVSYMACRQRACRVVVVNTGYARRNQVTVVEGWHTREYHDVSWASLGRIRKLEDGTIDWVVVE